MEDKSNAKKGDYLAVIRKFASSKHWNIHSDLVYCLRYCIKHKEYYVLECFLKFVKKGHYISVLGPVLKDLIEKGYGITIGNNGLYLAIPERPKPSFIPTRCIDFVYENCEALRSVIKKSDQNWIDAILAGGGNPNAIGMDIIELMQFDDEITFRKLVDKNLDVTTRALEYYSLLVDKSYFGCCRLVAKANPTTRLPFHVYPEIRSIRTRLSGIPIIPLTSDDIEMITSVELNCADIHFFIDHSITHPNLALYNTMIDCIIQYNLKHLLVDVFNRCVHLKNTLLVTKIVSHYVNEDRVCRIAAYLTGTVDLSKAEDHHNNYAAHTFINEFIFPVRKESLPTPVSKAKFITKTLPAIVPQTLLQKKVLETSRQWGTQIENLILSLEPDTPTDMLGDMITTLSVSHLHELALIAINAQHQPLFEFVLDIAKSEDTDSLNPKINLAELILHIIELDAIYLMQSLYKMEITMPFTNDDMLKNAFSCCAVEIAKLLIDLGAEFDYDTGNDKLVLAVIEKKCHQTLQLLVDGGIDIKDYDKVIQKCYQLESLQCCNILIQLADCYEKPAFSPDSPLEFDEDSDCELYNSDELDGDADGDEAH